VLFVMPWIGRTRTGHLINIALLCVLLGGAAALTAQAIHEDYFAAWNSKEDILKADDPVLAARYEASERFLNAKTEAHREAERVIELAESPMRIPPTGALSMMYDDPLLQGPKLFEQNCASCHNFVDPSKPAEEQPHAIVNAKPTAPNLFGVGSEAWALGILNPEKVASAHYFGYEGSPFVDGEMATYVTDTFGADISDEQKGKAKAAFAMIAEALEAEAALPTGPKLNEERKNRIAEGRALIAGGLSEILDSGMSCTDCHKFHDTGDLGTAPDLTGYMSREWLLAFVRNPAGERFYGDNNDRMPAFGPHDNPQLNQLDDKSLGLIVDWLRGDWVRVSEPVEKFDEAE
jgi:ubiquinol-cytochrome c reductase cytochrome b subunit